MPFNGNSEMNGKRLILDTNAIILLLKGNNGLLGLTSQAEWIGVSIISKIEYLAFPDITEPDVKLFEQFLDRVEVIDLKDADADLVTKIIDTRREYKLKLPDAIIVSTAISNKCTLVTADKQLEKVKSVEILSF